jgi:hypothetical protein
MHEVAIGDCLAGKRRSLKDSNAVTESVSGLHVGANVGN